MPTPASSRIAPRTAGWSLIAAAVGFMAVFSYLAVRFDYPRVLDGRAADVLPALLALGDAGRAAWVVYALLPLLLVPAALGAARVLEIHAPHAMRVAMIAAVLSAASMVVGLARWPTVHWELATSYVNATPEAREAIEVTFDGLNVYLGNFVGELLGELSLNGFFVASGVALLASGRRTSGYAGIATGVVGWIAALRNVTTIVAPVAELNNYLLPAWLIVLGVTLIRWTAVQSAIGYRRRGWERSEAD